MSYLSIDGSLCIFACSVALSHWGGGEGERKGGGGREGEGGRESIIEWVHMVWSECIIDQHTSP